MIRELLVEFFRPGESNVSGRTLWRAGQLVLAAVLVVTNLVGAVAVVLISVFVIPGPRVHDVDHVNAVNAAVTAAYVVLAVPVGVFAGTWGLRRLRRWLVEDRPATPAEQRLVLRAPLRLFCLQLALWMGAAVLFGVLNGMVSASLGFLVSGAIALTGLSTAACAYLLSERLVRSAAARALAQGAPERLAIPGVASRAVLAWALGTGVPVCGLVAVGAFELAGGVGTRTQLAVTMVVLGGVALTVGLLAVGLAARATAAPVDSVRRGLRRVQSGDLDASVAVYDGTQLGLLQLGFNEMAVGLAERERIRDAFGTYVDPEVAERILREGTRLEGEEVEVTVMFIDVRDFTAFAERRSAPDVVAAVNELFDRVVPLVHAEGGRVDKFVGDGLLAVFGAPRRQPDHAARAFAAALAIEEEALPEDLRVGIGLNSGPVVAGNVGGAGRFEFGVIGDVVNTAARVEEATRQTGDTILLGERTKELLGASPVQLVPREGIVLKGKTRAVQLYAPQGS